MTKDTTENATHGDSGKLTIGTKVYWRKTPKSGARRSIFREVHVLRLENHVGFVLVRLAHTAIVQFVKRDKLITTEERWSGERLS